MTQTHETREGWLVAAVEAYRDWFDNIDHPLPDKIRISTGWSKRARDGSNGWCWITGATEDKVNNVFISPEEEDPVRVLAITLHELCHVADDCQNGHRGAFREMWKAHGFEGKATQSTPGGDLRHRLETLSKELGDYPHRKMNVGKGGRMGTPKQGTRMLKVVCPNDGYIVRTTAKWLEMGLPTCPCGEEMVHQD